MWDETKCGVCRWEGMSAHFIGVGAEEKKVERDGGDEID